jgi:hypothetical protein
MTLLWFLIWLIANVIGDHEPLVFDPVNWWAGTLILAAALDLARQHAPERRPQKAAADSSEIDPQVVAQ